MMLARGWLDLRPFDCRSQSASQQCVGIYFDQASKYTNWSQGVLDQLKDVKAMLEFKITVQDEKDPNKVHIVQAYRAQHSFHRLPWSDQWLPTYVISDEPAAREASASPRW